MPETLTYAITDGVATITLKNVDDYLTLPQKQEVLKTKRTAHGHKVVKRG